MNESSQHLLLKGIEEEVFTGTPAGDIVGLSHEAKAALEGFNTEPDSRNTEFVSPPLRDYEEIGCTLMSERKTLRRWLTGRGGYTLIPGATMSTGDSSVFHIADPENDYYRFIRDTYFTRVVTAGVHVSIGLDDRETIVRASRLLRVEAALFLALSASSPFLDGRATGMHSQRWAQFPQTPEFIPLFEDHEHYRSFVRSSIEKKAMQNTRHLWVSARPNGVGVPDDLNRVELRVFDQIPCPRKLVSLAALLEARVWMMLEDGSMDPLTARGLPSSTRADDLMEIIDFNNGAVMKKSLGATVRRWENGKKVAVRDWLEEYYENAMTVARSKGFEEHLLPVRDILIGGNTAMRWLEKHNRGWDVRRIIAEAIPAMVEAEVEHAARVCG